MILLKVRSGSPPEQRPHQPKTASEGCQQWHLYMVCPQEDATRALGYEVCVYQLFGIPTRMRRGLHPTEHQQQIIGGHKIETTSKPYYLGEMMRSAKQFSPRVSSTHSIAVRYILGVNVCVCVVGRISGIDLGKNIWRPRGLCGKNMFSRAPTNNFFKRLICVF